MRKNLPESRQIVMTELRHEKLVQVSYTIYSDFQNNRNQLKALIELHAVLSVKHRLSLIIQKYPTPGKTNVTKEDFEFVDETLVNFFLKQDPEELSDLLSDLDNLPKP